ncbi:MAG: DUF2793 domain-containing protein [Pseudomonadota bacterium]|nr:DUF2793 domain-containing protein [Pseudomonadota bacterium]
MDRTPNLDMPFILPSQAQKHVTHNEALASLDALVQLAVHDRNRTEPPLDPAPGDRHIVADGATGAWAGHDGEVAVLADGAWLYLAPREGWIAWIGDENMPVVHDGTEWTALGSSLSSLNNLSLLGIGTTADAANPLSARLNSALLTARETGEGGDGDLRLSANKQAPAGTVSHLLQSGYSGRAEFGLLGDDDFSLKVSADGAAWTEALRVDRATGAISFPAGISAPGGWRERLAADRAYHVDAATGSDDNDGLSPGAAFASLQKAVDVVFGTLDLGGNDVTISVAAGTYTSGVAVNSPQVGAGRVILEGDTATPSNCEILLAAGNCVHVTNQAKLFVRGMKVSTGSGIGFYAAYGGTLTLQTNNAIGAISGVHAISSDYGGFLKVQDALVLEGDLAANLFNAFFGFLDLQSLSLTIVGTPNVGGAVATASISGFIFAPSFSFTGSLIGQRYSVSYNSVIQTFGGGDLHFPGTLPGVDSTGGHYA